MAQVIVIESGSSKAAKTVEALKACGVNDSIVLASNAGQEPGAGNNLLDLVREADLSNSSNVIFINSNSALSQEMLAKAIKDLSGENSTTLRFTTLKGNTEIAEIPELTIPELANFAASEPTIPAACFMAKREFLLSQNDIEAQTIGELAASLLVKAVADQESISTSTSALTASDAEIQANKLSKDESARVLQSVVSSSNIEELFPNHAWKTHETESFAACYHSLAAMFLRLNDTEHASECLNYSENLEESPRAMALKGLIAIKRGETLGAVANMISSLQQYEVRKKDSAEHYLSFNPSSFEDINSSLEKGLEALNKHDNSKALECFAKAIFEFDPFYQEAGISSIASEVH